MNRTGYAPVGFDHFALAGRDPLARAALAGTLHRNFQGFTDDDAPNLIGLGASSISAFPHLLVQNEKNGGRYRMRVDAAGLAPERGVRRDRQDRARGAIIEGLLCHGRATLPPDILVQSGAQLAPFVERGLVEMTGSSLIIAPGGLPYARTVAAIFDPYRAQSARRFSSAV
ncbi:hypothetical protein [Croceicoccus hydrothermalis]|uniref:hypothetical protein n=1 Tax=Croceicoccus hydrothermalis TaxID=2867964 RepID=UPI001EFA5BBF|nr:hypothetical protein [Croceicoccus hydrothermalis]